MQKLVISIEKVLLMLALIVCCTMAWAGTPETETGIPESEAGVSVSGGGITIILKTA
ncbi:MAG: hypothetical protein ACI3ZN_03175 [Candidatus Cryptobacteroides sp.]